MALPTDSIVAPVKAWLAKRLPRAVEKIGEVTVADIKARLDVPCPAFHGVLGGRHSPPGHEPYRETGALQDGITFNVVPSQQHVAVKISSTRAYGNPEVPSFLEWGTSEMAPRPYMRPARNRGTRIVPMTLRSELGA